MEETPKELGDFNASEFAARPSAPLPETLRKEAEETTGSTQQRRVWESKEMSKTSVCTEVSENERRNLLPFTDSQLSALYTNEELSCVDAYIAEFLENELQSNARRQQHRLNELLTSYLRVRNNLIINSHELEILKKNCKDIQRQLWCLEKSVISESGECQDGNPVSASHEYSIGHFNEQASVALAKKLSAIKELVHNAQALYSYEAELLKLQIDHYIQRVCISCKEFQSLGHDGAVNLKNFEMPSHAMPQMLELRTCVTILFNFQRRVLRDGKFVLDTREWLSKLIAILLRIANWQDHMFILNHILRCPGGVTNWAIGFVQVPTQARNRSLSTSALNDPYFDHMIATIAVILMPIKDRDKYLEQVQLSLQDTAGNPSDTVWVMLDEGGEEDEDIANTGANLFESDLMALLHQIPFDKLFEELLYVDGRREGYNDNEKYQQHRMLRLLAFSTVLVGLLNQGLRTYDSPRYRQLAKRLSGLIRDVVQHASDEWERLEKSGVNHKNIYFLHK